MVEVVHYSVMVGSILPMPLSRLCHVYGNLTLYIKIFINTSSGAIFKKAVARVVTCLAVGYISVFYLQIVVSSIQM